MSSDFDDDEPPDDLLWMDEFESAESKADRAAKQARSKMHLVKTEPVPSSTVTSTVASTIPSAPIEIKPEPPEEPDTCAACDHRRHVGRACGRDVPGGSCRCSAEEVLEPLEQQRYVEQISAPVAAPAPATEPVSEASGTEQMLADAEAETEAEQDAETEQDDETPDGDDEDERKAKAEAQLKKLRKWKCRGCRKKPSMTCICPWCREGIGPCHHCGNYYSLVKPKAASISRKVISAAAAQKMKKRTYLPTGITEFDDVIGGGLLLGNVLMIGGPRGTGKTILLIRAANEFAKKHKKKTFFAAGEMMQQAMVEYLQYFQVDSDDMGLYNNTDGIDVDELCDQILSWGAKFVVIDSVQYIVVSDMKKADIGSPAMITAAMNRLTAFAQREKIAFIVVGHLTKGGDYAGAETAQHMVDGLIRFEPRTMYDGDGRAIHGTEGLREVSMDNKNRQGSSRGTSIMEFFEKATAEHGPGVYPPSFAAIRALKNAEGDILIKE